MKNKATLMNPFPGLRSFRSDEDYLFFGRDDQALELVARLQRNRFIAVVGTSGQGKSSLVRCGLLSRLQGGGMVEAGAHWEIAVMHPGGDPLRHLAEALLETGLHDRAEENAVPQLLATLGRSQFGLIQAVRQAALPAGTNFLLVVDQFEEIFRYDEAGESESEVANNFTGMLREACAQTDVAIYVVATMRSDFIGDCARFEGLAEAVNRGEYLIPRLSREQFKSAIEGPIRVAGGAIAPRLLQRLLNDVGEEQDQLPCLQHALMRTWRVWQARADAPALDLEDYAQVGKMSQALSVHADEVYFGLATDRQRELCAAMFKALTVEGSAKRGIRRPRRLQALCRILSVEKAELVPIIDAFRQPEVSFVMPPSDVELRDTTVIDLSHESLMRVWTRLRDWVDEEAKSVGIFRRLSESAALWRQGKTGFYRDPELSIARAWLETSHPNASWAEQYEGHFEEAMAFLQASRAAEEKAAQELAAAQQRELAQARALAEAERARAEQQTRFAGRLKWMLRGVGLVAMVAVTAMLLAFAARREAQQNAALAQENEARANANARTASAEKIRADGQAERFRNQIYKVQLLRADTALSQFNGGDARTFLQDCEEPLRRWEWNYLAHRADQSVASLKAFDDGYAAIGFSPDGKHLMGVSTRFTGFRIWDAKTRVIVWDNALPRPPAREGTWSPASFSPDGKFVAVGGTNEIEIWEIATRQKAALIGIDRPTSKLQFSPDGQSIWSIHREGVIRLWDVAAGTLRREFKTGSFYAFAVAANGRVIATSSADGLIRIWNSDTASIERVITQQRGLLYSLEFSRDGRRLASGDGVGGLRIHDAVTGVELKSIDNAFKGTVRALNFSPDGRRLAAAGGATLRLWDTDTFDEPAVLLGHDTDIYSVQFAPDGQGLATSSVSGAVKFWRTTQPANPHVLRGHTGIMREVNFSPDGRRLVSASLDGTLRVWLLASGEELLTLQGHRGFAPAVAYSPDGAHIASGGSDARILLWDANTGKLTRTLRGHEDTIFWLTFSPDGKRLLTGARGGAAKLWDVETGNVLQSMETGGGGVEGARFSPDGKFFATCDQTNTGEVKIWATDAGEITQTLRGPQFSYRCVVFSPDGQSVAVGVNHDNNVASAVLWNRATGKFQAFKGQGGRVRTVAFSPDGRRLFGGAAGSVISVWDTSNGEQLLAINALQGAVWSVHISPDGRTLVSSGGTENAAIHVWEVDPVGDEIAVQRRMTAKVRRIVAERSNNLPFAADVIASLQSDTALDATLRKAAIRLVETRGDNPNAMFAAAQQVLRDASAPSDALALALRRAETVLAAWPDDTTAQSTLGLAQFRTGRFAEAKASASKAQGYAHAQFKAASPIALLIEAMADARLGNMEKAKSTFAQARALPVSTFDSEPDRKTLAQLAEQMIR